MSINAYNPQAGATNVANIPSGEGVLDTRKHVVLSFKNMTHSCDIMKNKFEGKIMLTNKRVSLIGNKLLLTRDSRNARRFCLSVCT